MNKSYWSSYSIFIRRLDCLRRCDASFCNGEKLCLYHPKVASKLQIIRRGFTKVMANAWDMEADLKQHPGLQEVCMQTTKLVWKSTWSIVVYIGTSITLK